jgi:hypothetical protein
LHPIVAIEWSEAPTAKSLDLDGSAQTSLSAAVERERIPNNEPHVLAKLTVKETHDIDLPMGEHTGHRWRLP